MELCINRPLEAFLETGSGWRRESLPYADFEWCETLAKLVANSTQQRIDATSPLLSASLPTGERVQIVMPPATTAGCVAIAIRRPADEVWSIEDLAARGIFRKTRRANHLLDDTEHELKRLLSIGDYQTFMRLAVTSRKNILVSGPTGSGKTTWTKALIREIPSKMSTPHLQNLLFWERFLLLLRLGPRSRQGESPPQSGDCRLARTFRACARALLYRASAA